MIPRQTNYVPHSQPPVFLKLRRYLSTTWMLRTYIFHNSEKRDRKTLSCFVLGTAKAKNSLAASLQVQLTFSVLLSAGVFSWVKQRGFRVLEPRKSTEGKFGATKKSSVSKLALLPECFGLSARLKKLPLLRAVASAISNLPLQARRNGPVTRWPSSSRKFLNVIVSGTCA